MAGIAPRGPPARLAGLEDGDRGAALGEVQRERRAGEPGTDDGDVGGAGAGEGGERADRLARLVTGPGPRARRDIDEPAGVEGPRCDHYSP